MRCKWQHTVNVIFMVAISCLAARAAVVDMIVEPDKDGNYEYIDWHSVTGYVTVPVFFATTRSKPNDSLNSESGSLQYGRRNVLVPLRPNSMNFDQVGWAVHQQCGIDKQFMATHDADAPSEFLSKNQFEHQLQRSLPKNDRRIVVFTHGFNTSFNESLHDAAELAYWYARPVVVFSWPSAKAKDVLSLHQVYTSSEERVDGYSDAYECLITNLVDLPSVGKQNIVLVAHSMGNHLLQQLLRDASSEKISGAGQFNEVVFCSADLDGMEFANEANSLLNCANQSRIYFNANDSALKESTAIHRHKPRLGSPGAHIDKVARMPNVQLIDVEAMLLGSFDHDLPDWLLAHLSNENTCNCAPDWQLRQIDGRVFKLEAIGGGPLARWQTELRRRARRVKDATNND